MSEPRGSSGEPWRDRLVYLAYAAGWGIVRRLPETLANGLFQLIADVVWRGRPASVVQLEANLRRVRPSATYDELRALSRAGMRSYLRYWCETFRLPDWNRDRVVGTVRVENESNLRNPLRAGRGVVAALPHMGNWDHAGAWASLTDAPVVTVAERLRPERLFARFLAYRERLGMEILPLTGGQSHLLSALTEALRQVRFVPQLADRDLRATGVEVELLGEPTRMPPGPAMLALRTGAALLPVSIWYQPGGRGIVIRFHDEVVAPTTGRTREKVAAMTQEVADVFSAAIRAHPADWHMLQPLWLADFADQPRSP